MGEQRSWMEARFAEFREATAVGFADVRSEMRSEFAAV
jgi:hypothetical protein